VHFEWVSIEEMSDTVKLAVVAAEDVNFCQHWGFDMTAIRAAIEDGGNRGASTLTQQVVKNTFLWHGRSWTRKTFEAFFTPLVELFWSKQRILEVYLNVAEFDKGVFGVEAAALHYFGISSDSLTLAEAARLAAILPDPKGRSASAPTQFVLDRADNIQDGALLIQKDQRSHCFMD
jgi:monofunctional biosynthetic peptidoglycan transglycosylase